MPEKLLILDGQGFCYRAFYAIRELTNSKGEPTNAIYGFIMMFRKLIQEEKPDYIAICFDLKGPTFRHKKYAQYKANRKPMPEPLVEQMPHIKEFAQAYGIKCYELEGYEADDLIGTLTIQGKRAHCKVVIATSDKDAFQLVDDQVVIHHTHKEKMITKREVAEIYDGIKPTQVVDVLGLMGDASDNIPGVPGIGQKTAVDLVREFGSIEKIYKCIDKVKGTTRQKQLRENEPLARLSRDLAVIDCQAPVEFNLEDLKPKSIDQKKLGEFYKRFEFRTLLHELTPTGETESEERQYHLIDDEKKLNQLLEKLKKTSGFAIDTETTSVEPMAASLVGISVSWKPFAAYYIPVSIPKMHKGGGLDWKVVQKKLKPILENAKQEKWGQNIKYDYLVLKRHGIVLQGKFFDTMIASYLINPVKFNHNLDDISFEYLSVRKIPTKDLIGTGKKQITMDEVPLDRICDYACEDVDCVSRLVPVLKKLLQVHGLEKLFHEMEIPLVLVLAQMEEDGVQIDKAFLKKLSKQAETDLEKLTVKIHKEAGEEFNINSTKQLSDILFNKLKLPVIKRTKTGYSTNVGVLEKLAQTYDLPKLLLEYREKSKLKSTYMDAFPELINPETGFIHTSFNQTVTSTGRLSSSDPNLQNIPIRTEAGREIRRAFIPRVKSREIVSADYSQIELRILAHLSKDKNLIRAFKDDIDIHAFTATLLYGVQEADVTREMRNVAKTINFSIVYGVSAFGLAQSLKLSIPEAQKFIDSYFERYAGVKDYLESQKQKAHDQGFLSTLFERKSFFPDINSTNPMMKQFAERAAINAPIQGTAADLIKVAMIQIQRKLREKKLECLMVIQVHDELVFDVPKKELEEAIQLIRSEMESAAKLCVPLKVDVVHGDSWFKA